MKIAFFTGHAAGQPRKASVSLIAEALRDMGHDISIFTTGYSKIAKLLGDGRSGYLDSLPAGQWVNKEGIAQYVHMPLLNAGRFPLRILNSLTGPFFKAYAGNLPSSALEGLRKADVIYIESGAGILYTATLKKHIPFAKFIYVASDRLSTLKVHPVIEQVLAESISSFDKVLCPAMAITHDFPSVRCHYIPQGVDKALLDKDYANPYMQAQNIISIGDMLFDAKAVEALAQYASGWTIHLFGSGAKASAPNIIVHGEQSFEHIMPYLKYADIGLAPYRAAPDADYLSQSSLKMQQYSYVQLPIIVPNFAVAGRPNAIGYDAADLTSIRAAFERAKAYEHTSIDKDAILSWSQVAQKFLDIL